MDISNFIYDPSCVLYLPLWKKDCATTQTIYSDDAYGHQCTVTGATWGRQGRYFDGNSLINCGSSPGLRIPQLTLAVWVKSGIGANAQYLAGNGNAVTGRDGYSLDLSNAGGVELLCCDAAGFDLTTETYIGSARTWTFVVGLWGNDFIQIYQNQIAGTQTARTKTMTWANPFVLGRNASSALYYLTGYEGELFIFNHALTPSRIGELYRVTKWRYA